MDLRRALSPEFYPVGPDLEPLTPMGHGWDGFGIMPPIFIHACYLLPKNTTSLLSHKTIFSLSPIPSLSPSPLLLLLFILFKYLIEREIER
jgi:hypothetical protein